MLGNPFSIINKIKTIFVFVFMMLNICSSTPSYAKVADVFNDCKVPKTDGQGNIDKQNYNVFVDEDSQYCTEQCEVFSSISSSQQDNPQMNTEANNDIISACKMYCMKEQNSAQSKYDTYSARYRTNTTSSTSITTDSGTTNMSVTLYPYNGSANAGLQKREKKEKTQDDVLQIPLSREKIFRISIDNSSPNAIYACGYRSVVLTPTFPNLFEMSPSTVIWGNAMQNNTVELGDISQKYGGFTTFSFDKYLDKVNGASQFDNLNTILEKVRNSQQDVLKEIGVYQDSKNTSFEDTYKGISNQFSQEQHFFIPSRFSSNKNPEWTDDSVGYHPCFAYLEKSPKNKDTISCPSDDEKCLLRQNIAKAGQNNTSIIDISTNPYSVGCYPEWHIYNNQYLDTGIKLSDGDFLKISWGGDIVLGNGLTIPFFNQPIAKLISANKRFNYEKSPFEGFSKNSDIANNYATALLRDMSTLDMQNMELLVGENGSKSENNNSTKRPLCGGKNVDDISTGNKSWYGLQGTIYRNEFMLRKGVDTSQLSAFKEYAEKLKKDPNADVGEMPPLPCDVVEMKADRYEFSGNLKNIGQQKPLAVRHYIPDNYIYKNSIITGGYQVAIEWGGCPLLDGEGLEYAAGKKDSTSDQLTWHPMKVDPMTSFTIKPSDKNISGTDGTFDPSADTLFLRVNPQGKYGNANPESFKTTYGKYNIIVQTESIETSDSSNNILTNMAMTIFSTLIGDVGGIEDTNKKFNGAVVKLLDGFLKSFAKVIQLAAVLYIAFTGIGFMIGTIKINQQELILRVVKLAAVIGILSPTVRDTLTQGFIRVFIVGVLQLASRFHDIFFEIVGYSVRETSDTSIFNFWEMTWSVLQYAFSQELGYKLAALVASNIFGLFMALMIAISIVIMMITVVQSAFIFISCMVTQAILIITAPFFIPLKLFAPTKDMFDFWVKQVISFALMPIGVSITTTLMFLLLKISVEAMLNFTYCWGCWFGIDFGFINVCIVKIPYLLNNLFVPDAVRSFLPMGIVAGVLTFALLSRIGIDIIGHAVRMISQIVTFRAEAFGQGSTTGLLGSISQDVMQLQHKVPQYMQRRAEAKQYETKKRLDSIGRDLDKL